MHKHTLRILNEYEYIWLVGGGDAGDVVGGESRAQLAATGGVGVRGRAKLAHNADNKIRHLKGKYTVKEEVIRRVEHSYPCKLVETAVKVTFPGMKSEVLVSFLGYKEPNLMQVSDCVSPDI